VELPIFPLNTVLFPGGRLPLHIFEERYKLMISRCLEHNEPFGVCLIRRGAEVGDATVETFRVGTTAHIRELQELDEGRLNIVCTGGERFAIREITCPEPYITAAVETVECEDCDDPTAASLAEETAALFTDYVRLNLAMTNEWARSIEMPSGPGALSDYVGGALGIDLLTKQRLLEQTSPVLRLQAEIAILGASIAQLASRVQVVRASRWRGFSARN
jgi:Lon protease-like protein